MLIRGLSLFDVGLPVLGGMVMTFPVSIGLIAIASVYAVVRRTQTPAPIRRIGNTLKQGDRNFHLTNAGTKAAFAYGLTGCALKLTNQGESTTLQGCFADLKWIKDQVKPVDLDEAEQIPQQIQRLRSTEKR